MADRLALDPVMRQVVGGSAVRCASGPRITDGRFETETLALREPAALADLNGHGSTLHGPQRVKFIVLDMDRLGQPDPW